LLIQNETKITGLAITPNLNLKYRLGKVTLWSGANVLMLPKVTTTGSTWKPYGNADGNNQYQMWQMQDGATTNWQKLAGGKAVGINAGITIGLGKANYQGHVTLLR
jgi:hypothetical protein